MIFIPSGDKQIHRHLLLFFPSLVIYESPLRRRLASKYPVRNNSLQNKARVSISLRNVLCRDKARNGVSRRNSGDGVFPLDFEETNLFVASHQGRFRLKAFSSNKFAPIGRENTGTELKSRSPTRVTVRNSFERVQQSNKYLDRKKETPVNQMQ